MFEIQWLSTGLLWTIVLFSFVCSIQRVRSLADRVESVLNKSFVNGNDRCEINAISWALVSKESKKCWSSSADKDGEEKKGKKRGAVRINTQSTVTISWTSALINHGHVNGGIIFSSSPLVERKQYSWMRYDQQVEVAIKRITSLKVVRTNVEQILFSAQVFLEQLLLFLSPSSLVRFLTRLPPSVSVVSLMFSLCLSLSLITSIHTHSWNINQSSSDYWTRTHSSARQEEGAMWQSIESSFQTINRARQFKASFKKNSSKQ